MLHRRIKTKECKVTHFLAVRNVESVERVCSSVVYNVSAYKSLTLCIRNSKRLQSSWRECSKTWLLLLKLNYYFPCVTTSWEGLNGRQKGVVQISPFTSSRPFLQSLTWSFLSFLWASRRERWRKGNLPHSACWPTDNETSLIVSLSIYLVPANPVKATHYKPLFLFLSSLRIWVFHSISNSF